MGRGVVTKLLRSWDGEVEGHDDLPGLVSLDIGIGQDVAGHDRLVDRTRGQPRRRFLFIGHGVEFVFCDALVFQRVACGDGRFGGDRAGHLDELQQRRLADQADSGFGVFVARQLDDQALLALKLDDRLQRAQRINTLLDDAAHFVHCARGWGGALRQIGLQQDFHATGQVEAPAEIEGFVDLVRPVVIEVVTNARVLAGGECRAGQGAPHRKRDQRGDEHQPGQVALWAKHDQQDRRDDGRAEPDNGKQIHGSSPQVTQRLRLRYATRRMVTRGREACQYT